VTVWRWVAMVILAMAALLGFAPACIAAPAAGVGSPPLAPLSQGGERQARLQDDEAPGVGSPPLAPPSQGGERQVRRGETDSRFKEGRVDAALEAREVLQDQDYWWKRIEKKTIPTTGLLGFFEKMLELPGRVLRAIWDFVFEFFRGLALLLRGDWSAGSSVVWLLAIVLLGWAMWRLYPLLKYLPVIARWLAGGAAPGAQKATTVSWEALPESSDLFLQASNAFANSKYADAIRLALLALIARLEKQGLLRYDTTRTNREYQGELRSHKELAASFGQLARIYERVWYGRESAGPAEAEQAIGLCRLLIHREDLVPE
jgi:hypothetical protein